jgi:large subunit ribosomal protein L18
MNRLTHKKQNYAKRAHRVRAVIAGTADRPRLSVHVSNMHVTAQIIDDANSKTLAYVTTVGQKQSGSMVEKAAVVGKEIAVIAKKAKVNKVVFDRGAKKYHGRVKALADAAREGGLEF